MVLIMSQLIMVGARVAAGDCRWTRAVGSFRTCLIACAVTGTLSLVGCDTPASTPMPKGAVPEGICVVQVRSDYIEIRPLDGPPREYRIPDIRKTAPLFQGRLAPHGSFAAGSADTGFLGVKLDGRQAWAVKDVSFPGRPAISSDAKSVAFTARDGRLVVFDVATGALKDIGVRGQNPAWSFTGDRLAYDDGAEVRVYELARGTNSEVGRGTEPSWLPDGASLAVRVKSTQVDVVKVQTRERRILIDASKSISVPLWSPDGAWMMYTQQGPRHWWSKAEWTGSEPSQILVRDVKSGAEASIGEFYKANPGDYTWVSNRELCQALTAQ
jgi:hypothetical protein